MMPLADKGLAVNQDEPEAINCPLCNKGQFSVLHKISHPEHKTNKMFKVVKCHGCGLTYLNPRTKKDFIKRYYPKTYYQTEASDPEVVLKTGHEKEKIGLVKGFGLLKDKKKSLLDVGCNKGEFLENLKRAGWRNLKGVEFDKSSVEFAKEKYNLDIFLGDLEDYPEDKNFDIITFWHSLEHLYDIDSALEKSDKLLRPDGALIISAPNIKSIQAHIMGKHWYHLEIPRHIIFFDKTTLERLLKKHNFLIIKRTYRYPSHNFDGWYCSFLKMRDDFKIKYSKKKNIEDRPYTKKELLTKKSLLLDIILRWIARFLSAIETVLGSGAAITIIAKREKCRS